MTTHITSHHPAPPPGRRADLYLSANVPPTDAGASGRLLDASEVAGLLGVPRSFVYSLARRGGIPTVRLGDRYIRFRRDAVQAWISEREQSGRWS